PPSAGGRAARRRRRLRAEPAGSGAGGEGRARHRALPGGAGGRDAQPRLDQDGLLAARHAHPVPHDAGARVPGRARLRVAGGRQGGGHAHAGPPPGPGHQGQVLRRRQGGRRARAARLRPRRRLSARVSTRSVRPVRSIPVLGALVRWHEERLTARGRYVMWAAGALGFMGADTRRSQVYVLFALASGALLAAVLLTAVLRPRARLECALPARATAHVPLVLRARVWAEGRPRDHLRLSFQRPVQWGSSLQVRPRETFLAATPEAPTEARVELRPVPRGRYVGPAPPPR